MTLFKDNMSVPAFLDWGWRVPFYLSGILIGIGLLIRIRILETPLFAELQRTNQVAKSPIIEAIRGHGREIFLAVGTRLSENACFYLFSAYVIAYAKDVLKVEERIILRAVNLAAAAEFFTIPAFGLLSDRWSRKGTYIVGCLFMISFSWPYYAMLETRHTLQMTLAVILSLAVGHALLYSVQGAMIPELFGTRLRYTGASLGYQLGAPLAGGLAPLIASLLVKGFPDNYLPLAGYIVVISVISLACVLRLSETSTRHLSES
jgi:MFS family permease